MFFLPGVFLLYQTLLTFKTEPVCFLCVSVFGFDIVSGVWLYLECSQFHIVERATKCLSH